jgi:spore germination protein
VKVSIDIDENINQLDEFFLDCGDVSKRKFSVGKDKMTSVYIIYIDMLVDRNFIETQVINRLMLSMWQVETAVKKNADSIFEILKDGGITTAELEDSNDMDLICDEILGGNTVLFIDGADNAIILSTKGQPSRGVPTAEGEVVIQGSKEAFSEVFRINTMLIRRRIRDTNLKVKQVKVGRRSKTDVAIMYLDGIVRPDILADAESRIANIDIDAILDVGYIDQLMQEDWLTPFPQAETTERPDKASAAILEGRIAIIVDNCPFVLIIPCTLNTFFQSSEDYYQGFEIMSLVRTLRYVAGILAVTLPGLYIAIAVYHPSMLPMALIFKMSSARQNVPFPAIVEILLMEIAFELLREAGIRLPAAVGSTIGIVGGIIVGQAAVEAGLVSPIVVIVVAFTGVCSFTIPQISLVNSFRIIKFLILMGAATLGLFGFWVASLIILIHLVSLKNYGIPYTFPFSSGELNGYKDLKDTIFRFPLFYMKKRPIFANPRQATRMGEGINEIIKDKE